MTDEEVICTFMEPRPADNFGGSTHWWFKSLNGVFPNELTLDRLHEVEARLTDEQVCDYDVKLNTSTKWDGHNSQTPAAVFPWHADAKQKIKALAAVLRPVVLAREAAKVDA